MNINSTIEQANEKVCPFITIPADLANPYKNGTQNINCIAQRCMSWFTTKTHEQIEDKTPPTDDKVSCMSRFSDGKELSDEMKEGFCARNKI